MSAHFGGGPSDWEPGTARAGRGSRGGLLSPNLLPRAQKAAAPCPLPQTVQTHPRLRPLGTLPPFGGRAVGQKPRSREILRETLKSPWPDPNMSVTWGRGSTGECVGPISYSQLS